MIQHKTYMTDTNSVGDSVNWKGQYAAYVWLPSLNIRILDRTSSKVDKITGLHLVQLTK